MLLFLAILGIHSVIQQPGPNCSTVDNAIHSDSDWIVTVDSVFYNTLIHWISIYTADSVIQSLNNGAKMYNGATQTIDPSDSLMRLVRILEDNQPAF